RFRGDVLMKKSLWLLAIAALFASNAFAASYWVVLKDGSRFECRAKPVIANGKATFITLAGQTFNVEASQYDLAKSEEATRYGGAQVFNIGGPGTTQTGTQQAGLGSQIKLRKLTANPAPASVPAVVAVSPVAAGSGELSMEVLQKFERAFENVGIYE